MTSPFALKYDSMMLVKPLLFGILLGVLIIPLAGYLFVISGGMPVATKSKPLPLEEKIAHMSLRAAKREARSKPSPIPASDEHLLHGAKLFVPNCAQCHGLPGKTATPTAKGMFPAPPQLFTEDENVEHDPIGQTYWVVKNGIRLTGMPGFEASISEDELWEVSLLLQKAMHLPAAVQTVLSSLPEAAGPSGKSGASK